MSFEFAMAGALNVKAATALLPDYDNDIEKLRAAEPWLFSASAPALAPADATGAAERGRGDGLGHDLDTPAQDRRAGRRGQGGIANAEQHRVHM